MVRRAQSRLRCVAGLLGCLAVTPAAAADLLSVYQRAQDKDATFAKAQAEYRAAREAWPQARAAVLPQVNLQASTAEVDSTDNVNDTTTEFDEESYSLELRQTLFDWAAFAGLDKADAQVARAEAQLAAAQQKLITRVAQAYFDVLTARDALRFARAEKRAVKRQLEQARERFEVGLIPVTDVKEAKSSFDLAVARELEAQNQLDQAQEALRKITSRTTGDLAGAKDAVPLAEPDPAETKPWVQRALEQNPDLLAARAGAKSARHGMQEARAGYYPQVELVARRSNRESQFTQGGRPRDIDETEDRISVELTWNLFAGGRTYSRSAEARATFQQAQSRVIEVRRGVKQRTRDAFRAVQTSLARVRALREAVESSRARVEATRSGFEVGTRTSVDVLNAVRDLYRAQRDLAEARYNYIVNRLRLRRAAGTLNQADVRRVNGWLTANADAGSSDAKAQDGA